MFREYPHFDVRSPASEPQCIAKFSSCTSGWKRADTPITTSSALKLIRGARDRVHLVVRHDD